MRTADTAIAEPVVATWAPGRVNLIGEHTDYGGGLVLPTAIQLGIALEVLSVSDEISLALCAIADFELEPLELALACQRAELRAVGVPCGILDQAACVLGRAGAAVLLDCATLVHRLIPVPARASLLVIDCGVERRLEATPYALRRYELERALELDRAGRPLDAVSRRRLRHFRTENERVRRFAAALEADNLEEAGRLLTASHAGLRDDYEVSIPELDLLVELAESAGAYGARLLGAGFGGSILALVDADRAGGVPDAIADEYRARAGREAGAVVARPSAGACVR